MFIDEFATQRKLKHPISGVNYEKLVKPIIYHRKMKPQNLSLIKIAPSDLNNQREI